MKRDVMLLLIVSYNNVVVVVPVYTYYTYVYHTNCRKILYEKGLWPLSQYTTDDDVCACNRARGIGAHYFRIISRRRVTRF